MQIPEQIRSTFSGETLKQLTDSLAEALEAGFLRCSQQAPEPDLAEGSLTNAAGRS